MRLLGEAVPSPPALLQREHGDTPGEETWRRVTGPAGGSQGLEEGHRNNTRDLHHDLGVPGHACPHVRD